MVPPPVTISYIRNANFYRVVSATENTAGFLDVELATPLKADSMTTRDPNGNPTVPPAGGVTRSFMVLKGVVDVFERNNLTAADVGP